VLGSALLISGGLLTSVPVVGGFLIRTYDGLASGSVSTPRFWDSAVTGLLFVAQFSVLVALIVHDRRRLRVAGDA